MSLLAFENDPSQLVNEQDLAPAPQAAAPGLPPKLQRFADEKNIAELLDEDQLGNIGQRVLDEYAIDKSSRSEWETVNQKALKVAKQVAESKSFPWDGCANVLYPLVTTACIQFAARALPELIPGPEVVKAKVVGEDPNRQKQDRADRISEHMSWQVTEEMEDWPDSQDSLMHVLPLTGICFKKTYFDSTEKHNESELVLPDDCVVNYRAKKLETARRVTHLRPFYRNDIFELQTSGVWLNYDFGISNEEGNDEDAPHTFLEQHRYLDLDKDGYQEPYIVTVHKDTGKVARIVARYDAKSAVMNGSKLVRIKPHQYFTKYSLIPAPDGSFYDIGFGSLLYPMNEAINTLINQLLDAGTMANTGGGFLSKALKMGRQQSGVMSFAPNEWRFLDVPGSTIRDSVFPLPVRDPSAVLFSLLEFLVNAGKELANINAVLNEAAMAANIPATTVLAAIEQGQKVYASIYQRLWRAMGREFKKLYWLNSVYLDPVSYYTVLDTQKAVSKADYNTQDHDVCPVADPNMSSDMTRMAQAQALLQITGRPNVNEDEITDRYLRAIKTPEPEKILPPADQRPPASPDPLLQIEMGKLQAKTAELELKHNELLLKAQKQEAEIEKIRADAIKSIAEAESKATGMALERERLIVESLDREDARNHEVMMSQAQAGMDQQAAMEQREHEMGMAESQMGHEREMSAGQQDHEAGLEEMRQAAAAQAAQKTTGGSNE